MKCDYCGADLRARELAAHVAREHQTLIDEMLKADSDKTDLLRKPYTVGGDNPDIAEDIRELWKTHPDAGRMPTHLSPYTMLTCGEWCGNCGAAIAGTAPLHKHGLTAEDVIRRTEIANRFGIGRDVIGATRATPDPDLDPDILIPMLIVAPQTTSMQNPPINRAERMPITITSGRVPCGFWCGWCSTSKPAAYQEEYDIRLFAGMSAEQIARALGITVEALREEHAKRRPTGL